MSACEWKKMVSSRLDFQVINLHLSQEALSQGPLKFLLLLSFNIFALWSLFKGNYREVEWPLNEYFYYLVFTGMSLKFIFSDFVLFSSLPLLHLIFRRLHWLNIFQNFQFIFLIAWEWQCFEDFILVLLFHYINFKCGLWFMVIGLEGLLCKFFFLSPVNKT